MQLVAALDVVAIAFVALILAVAFFQLFKPLVLSGLSSVPVIGGWLAVNTDLVLLRAYASVVVWADQATGPLADAIANVHLTLGGYAESAVVAAEAITGALWRVRFQLLPWTLQTATDYARQLAGQVSAYALALMVRALQYTDARVGQAIAYAQQLAAAETAYAQALAVQETAYAQQLAAAETAYAQALAVQGVTYTQAAVLGAERYAEQLAGQQLAFTQAAVLGAERYAQQLGADAEAYARVLQRQALGYADHVGAQALAGAAALVVPVAASVAAVEDSPCMRFCGPLGDLGDLLQQLEDVGLAGLLVALTAAALADPEGTASTITDLAAGPARDAAQLAAGEVGMGGAA